MRTIDADALKEAIRKRLCISSLKYLTAQEKVIVDEIDNALTVEPDKELNEKIETYKNAYRIMSDAFENEVRKNKRATGKWIPSVIDTGLFERSVCREWQCSNCGEVVKMKYPFCHCGADMRVKDELNNELNELEEGENE